MSGGRAGFAARLSPASAAYAEGWRSRERGLRGGPRQRALPPSKYTYQKYSEVLKEALQLALKTIVNELI